MLIYVAGPYSAPTLEGRVENTKRAMNAGLVVLRKGHTPVIPHLSHFFDVWVEEQEGSYLAADIYYEWDLKLLKVCDALLYLAPSFGTDRELKFAQEWGLQVYWSLEELPEES